MKKGAYMTFETGLLNGKRNITLLALVAAISIGVACTSTNRASTDYKANVKAALEQADLKDVSVAEDDAKNTITRGGTLHTEDAENRAASVARADGGARVGGNEVGVGPVGDGRGARKIE